ncbi:protein kinase [candidate division KSB1 bacterium]|nr:protein kinase [candidate division KSB1 bacterium]
MIEINKIRKRTLLFGCVWLVVGLLNTTGGSGGFQNVNAQNLQFAYAAEAYWNPAESPQAASDSLTARIQLGKRYFVNRQYDDAKSEFLAVLSRDSQNVEAFAYLGRIYLLQQKLGEASAVFKQALQVEPNNRIALNGLNQIKKYKQLRQYSRSIQNALNQRDADEALRYLRQMISLDSTYQEVAGFRQQIARILYQSGRSAEQQGERNLALRYYRRAQSVVPDYLNVKQKIELLEEQNDLQRELEANYQNGIYAYRRRNWDSAIESFSRVVKLDRGYKDAGELLNAAREAKTAALPKPEPPPEIREDTLQIAIAPPATVTPAIDSSAATGEMIPESPQHDFWDLFQRWWIAAIFLIVILIASGGYFFGSAVRSKFRRKKTRRLVRKPPTQKAPGAVSYLDPALTSDADTSEQPLSPIADLDETRQIAPELAEPSSDIPKNRSRYELRAPIRRIGNIKTYKGYDNLLERDVLIDKINLLGSDAGQQRMEQILYQGIRKAALLSHPNIIRIEDIYREDDSIFISLEYIEGLELAQLLKQENSLKVWRGMKIISQLCVALDYAHRKGVIHFDLRPENIKVMANDFVKLGGFELSGLMQIDDLTPLAIAKNDPTYMSPEQIKNGEVDLRTDIFSLGVIAYEMLTGQLPFKGEYISATVHKILEVTPQAPNVLNEDIPEELNNIVMKMLEKNIQKRYFNALDIALQLKKLIGSN